MKIEMIQRKGKRFAVVPLKDFNQLRHDADMLEDLRAYDAAKGRKEEAFPAEVADRLIDGENPIRVFRDHRAMTQHQLAIWLSWRGARRRGRWRCLRRSPGRLGWSWMMWWGERWHRGLHHLQLLFSANASPSACAHFRAGPPHVWHHMLPAGSVASLATRSFTIGRKMLINFSVRGISQSQMACQFSRSFGSISLRTTRI
jgi:hypothetical protein